MNKKSQSGDRVSTSVIMQDILHRLNKIDDKYESLYNKMDENYKKLDNRMDIIDKEISGVKKAIGWFMKVLNFIGIVIGAITAWLKWWPKKG